MTAIVHDATPACCSRARALLAGARAAACASPRPALRIGTNVWIGSEPLYLARELGRLDPGAVQLVEYPSASEVLRAFRNQAIDGMVISLDELFGLAVDGLQPRIILVVDVSHGADVVVGRRGMRTMQDLKGKSVAVESGALGAFVLSRALALQRHAGGRRQRRAPRVERAAGRVREGPGRRRGHVRSVPRAVPARPAPRRCSTARRSRARSSTCSPCAPACSRKQPEGDPGAARRLVRRARLHEARPAGRGAAHGHPPADERRAVPRGAAGLHIPSREENLRMLGGAAPELAVDRTAAHGADGRGEAAARASCEIESVLAPGPLRGPAAMTPAAFRRRSRSRCR